MARHFLWTTFLALAIPGVVAAQTLPPILPPTPPRPFDPAKLREAIVFPIGSLTLGVGIKWQDPEPEVPPIDVLEKKLTGTERDAPWLYKLGLAHGEAKPEAAKAAFEKAVDAYRRLIKIEPNVAEHHWFLAQALSELRRRAEATDAMRQVVRIDPKHTEAWHRLQYHYWLRLTETLFEGTNGKVSLSFNDPPWHMLKKLTPQDREQAREVLGEVERCYRRWRELAGDEFQVRFESGLIECHLQCYASFLDPSKPAPSVGALERNWISTRMVKLATEEGQRRRDPALYGIAAIIQVMLLEKQNPAELKGASEEQMKVYLMKSLAPMLDPMKDIAKGKDATAFKAHLTLATFYMLLGEKEAVMNHGRAALELQPREKSIIDFMLSVQDLKENPEHEAFWREHVRKHPTPHVWLHLGVLAFRKGDATAAATCFAEGEKVEPKDRYVQLGKAMLALKRGPEGLPEAEKILTDLEKRKDEPEPSSSLALLKTSPDVHGATRYLRAIHRSLAGQWREGQRDLTKLRNEKILAEDITIALEAFPFPETPFILPAQFIPLPQP